MMPKIKIKFKRTDPWTRFFSIAVMCLSKTRQTNSRVRISSWIFEIEFWFGFSGKDLELFLSGWLLIIQIVHKPSPRFPVQCSQQKNSCRGGDSVLSFYYATSLYKACIHELRGKTLSLPWIHFPSPLTCSSFQKWRDWKKKNNTRTGCKSKVTCIYNLIFLVISILVVQI